MTMIKLKLTKMIALIFIGILLVYPAPPASATCASVSSGLNVCLPCVEFGGNFYVVILNRYHHPSDTSGYYFLLDRIQAQGKCSMPWTVVDSLLNLSIPCIEVGSNRFQVILSSYANPADQAGLYWQLQSITPITSSSSWHISTIDDTVSTWNISMALDSKDHIHIVYNDLTSTQTWDNDLKYTTNISGSFRQETMRTAIGPISESRPGIAVDSADQLHVIYLDSHTNELKYAFKASNNWEFSTITSLGTGQGKGIAIDSHGAPHISYCGETGLYYATNTGEGWQIETIDQDVDNPGFMGSENAIALDADDKVHIGYYDCTNNRLLYASNSSGEWQTAIINNNVTVGNDEISIALDMNNQVHLSYHNLAEKDLIYASNPSGVWVNTVLDYHSGGFSSLAIDSTNKIHISYQNSGLKYATNSSGNWITEIIDDNGYMGFHSAIAIDSNDKIHICFHNYQDGNLLYATH